MSRKPHQLITPDNVLYPWSPQPGPQTLAVTCPADEVFLGGMRGGGKSDAVIGMNLRGSAKWGAAWNGIIIRKKYKEFAEMRRRIKQIIRERNLDAELIGGEMQPNYLRFYSGPAQDAGITLVAMGSVAAAEDYIGHQFTMIVIDEAPEIAYIAGLIDVLRGSLRSPYGVPCRMVFTGNPGGPGASTIKQMFVPRILGGDVDIMPNQIQYVVRELEDGQKVTISRVYIPSRLQDNKILYENDPRYVAQLQAIKDPMRRKAWLGGRWDITIGQAFDLRDAHTVRNPIWPIPEYQPIYMTMDWGWSAPTSIGWWWVDGDNRVYRFSEWYTWNGDANTGSKLTDEELAEGVIKKEKELGITGREIKRLAGPDCWNKKPDWTGKGRGVSTAEVFKARGLELRPGDPKKEIKIRRFRSRLRYTDTEPPMMLIYPNCKHFLRTIPDLVVDELTGEYIEDGQEDHVFDEACHICMDRPYGVTDDEYELEQRRKMDKERLNKLDNPSKQATLEYRDILDAIKNTGKDKVRVEELTTEEILN